jgi:hypothetical protein
MTATTGAQSLAVLLNLAGYETAIAHDRIEAINEIVS